MDFLPGFLFGMKKPENCSKPLEEIRELIHKNRNKPFNEELRDELTKRLDKAVGQDAAQCKELDRLNRTQNESLQKTEDIIKKSGETIEKANCDLKHYKEKNDRLVERNKELVKEVTNLKEQLRTGNVARESQQSETRSLSLLPREVLVSEKIKTKKQHQSLLNKFLEQCNYKTGALNYQDEDNIAKCAAENIEEKCDGETSEDTRPEEGNNVTSETINKKTGAASDIPKTIDRPIVLIPCVVASRIGSDLGATFEDAGLDRNKKYPYAIVIIFTPKAPHVSQNVVPTFAKMGDEFKVKDMVDVVFWDNDFYECHTNYVAVEKMKTIFKKNEKE